MYLCGTHHPLIDKNPSDYTAVQLKEMKAKHEGGNYLVTAEVLQQLVDALERPVVAEDWWLESGAPTFRVSPGIDNRLSQGGPSQLLMNLYQEHGDDITPQVEWRGEGILTAMPALMTEHRRNYKAAWQLKGAPISPNSETVLVTFHLWFRWKGAECHSEWDWTVTKHPDGHLSMNNEAGNVLTPARRWRLLIA